MNKQPCLAGSNNNVLQGGVGLGLKFLGADQLSGQIWLVEPPGSVPDSNTGNNSLNAWLSI